MKFLKILPGPKSKKIFDEEQRYISPGYQGIALYSKIALAKGRNAILTDEDGHRYIDFVSGLGVGSVGHCHPHYVKSLKAQLEKITFSSFSTKIRKDFLNLFS